MAIKNKFIHFKTRAAFDVNVLNPTATADDGNQFYNYTIFIQDTKEIYTHGTFYKCDISEEEVEALIASKGYITEDDIPVLSGGAAATSGQYVSGVTVSGHTVTVTKDTLPSNAKTATKLATERIIAISGAVTGSAAFDGSSNVIINSSLNGFDASKITSGTLNADRLPEIPISKIPAALPNPYALTINGISYTGSSAVSIDTARILPRTFLNSSTVSAGYSYNSTSSRTISSLSGFCLNNPDSVIISTAKLTFTAPNAIKMDGLADLSGTYYIYCLSFMVNGKVAINGAVYA